MKILSVPSVRYLSPAGCFFLPCFAVGGCNCPRSPHVPNCKEFRHSATAAGAQEHDSRLTRSPQKRALGVRGVLAEASRSGGKCLTRPAAPRGAGCPPQTQG